MIKIVAYHRGYFTALTSYVLDDEQSRFSQIPKQVLNNPDITQNKKRFQYCILLDEQPAGFFSLDFSTDRFVYTDNRDAVLLRALSINPAFQGKGVAKSAMLQLPDFVKRHFPKTTEIVFGVNMENESAYQLYLKTGYLDSGNLYEGIKGPQRVMYKEIT